MKESEKERERQKHKLRRGMTESPDPTEKPKKDELDIRLRRHRMLRGLIAFLVFVLAVGIFLCWEYERRKEIYEGHTIVWEKDAAVTERDRYLPYRDAVLRYNRDGISYMNSRGEALWTKSYQINDPVAAVNGNYAAVIDRDGYQLYICDESGCVGTVNTILPIRQVTVSAGGVTAIVLEDDLADKVYFYDLTGRQMNIEMKTLLTEDGYTLDMALSPDGQQLVTAYVYLDQGVMKNQVVFRNFGEEGQEMIKRLVGGFREYEGELIGRVIFPSDLYACAFAQDRVCFYSMRNRLSPQLVKQIDYKDEIYSVFYSADYVGVISEGGDSSRRKVCVYDLSGKTVTEFETGFAYTGANFSGNRVVLYNSSHCEMYNMNGDLKYEAAVGSDIRWLSCLSEDRIFIIEGKSVKEVKLTAANKLEDLLGRE